MEQITATMPDTDTILKRAAKSLEIGSDVERVVRRFAQSEADKVLNAVGVNLRWSLHCNDVLMLGGAHPLMKTALDMAFPDFAKQMWQESDPLFCGQVLRVFSEITGATWDDLLLSDEPVPTEQTKAPPKGG